MHHESQIKSTASALRRHCNSLGYDTAIIIFRSKSIFNDYRENFLIKMNRTEVYTQMNNR